MALAGAIVSIIGSVFLFLAAIGLIRMPDVYNRMQTGTKATTLGSFLFFLGVGLVRPNWLGKVALLIIFIVFTNPISSHALTRAACKLKISLGKNNAGNALAEDYPDEIAGQSEGESK